MNEHEDLIGEIHEAIAAGTADVGLLLQRLRDVLPDLESTAGLDTEPDDELVLLLGALFRDRGNDVRKWPADEAEAYREHGWEPGRVAATDVVNRKAAIAVQQWFAARFGTYGQAIDDLRWLIAARGSSRNPLVADELRAVQLAADILAGDNDALGWLPSWLWGEWDLRRLRTHDKILVDGLPASHYVTGIMPESVWRRRGEQEEYQVYYLESPSLVVLRSAADGTAPGSIHVSAHELREQYEQVR